MRKIALALLTCLSLPACQQVGTLFHNDESLTPKSQDPGKKLVVLPAEVWANEKCESRNLPYIRLDDSKITPKTIKAGSSIHYRFSYTACVPLQPGYMLGRFQTTIYFQGTKKSTRYDDGYPIETGKLIVDTDIAVPIDAEPGTYVLSASLDVADVKVEDRVSFNVEP